MLNCKNVVKQASYYLDRDQQPCDEAPCTPYWKIRLHLLLCGHCRRFMRHLQTTRTVATHIAGSHESHPSTDAVIKHVKEHQTTS